ncbi:hypothetical protein BKA62DRAFT_60253 [Auriculariales sp. MPI-PUGE-AT-0066]|nr:hypothetical protein BKA62DRAFT_60253 [Auriculariales sp. MPI-PUGE-AT-0066]
MKRSALVAYASSDEENEPDNRAPAESELLVVEPPKKKLKTLPKLSSSIYAHADDPTSHHGRTRSQRHVDGVYSSYIYASVSLANYPNLARVVQEVTSKACAYESRTVHSSLVHNLNTEEEILEAEPECAAELHISLSRPFYISANQRDNLKSEVQQLAGKLSSFFASFADLASLVNDDKSRGFLVMEVGAGHEQLAQMSQAANRILKLLRHDEFYSEPRFHASVAWTLLNPPLYQQTSSSTPSSTSLTTLQQFDGFPEDLLNSLRTDFSENLRRSDSVLIERVAVRIGKSEHSWNLKNHAGGSRTPLTATTRCCPGSGCNICTSLLSSFKSGSALATPHMQAQSSTLV